MVVNIGPKHTCASTSRMLGKEATVDWIVDRGKDILSREPTIGAREMQRRLEGQFNIDLDYNRIWVGKRVAMEDLHGSWEDSLKLLWNFKAALEKNCPGSVVEIDCKKVGGQMCFSRMFVAFWSCVDGFLVGCRPYLGVDSTHLTGKYNGQLVAATAIDGHNWMYPVAYAIFDKETNSNWAWFMTQLKRAIGTPTGLTIHIDACKGLDFVVGHVFGDTTEHIECFRHLMMNFRKKFKGDVLKYMWASAWTCKPERYEKLLAKIEETCPPAVAFLQTHHKHLWSRANFAKIAKLIMSTTIF